jgi:hypothetical protein
MLPALTNMTGGTKVLASSRSRIASPQASSAAAQHHQHGAERQPLVARQFEGLGHHRGNHQRRHEHVHVEFVGEGHVDAAAGASIAGVAPADRDHGENRKDDGNDPQQRTGISRDHST